MRSYNTYKLRTLIKHGAFPSLSLSLSLPQRRRSQGMTQGDTASDCGERGTERRLAVSLSLSLSRSSLARSLSLSLSLSVLTTSHFSHLSACSRVQSAFALLLPQQKAASRRRSMVSWRFSAESTSMALAASLLPQRCASCTGLSPKCVAIVASAPYSKRARIISVLALFAAAESPRW